MPLTLPTKREQITLIQSKYKRIAVERALATPFHKKRIPSNINLDHLNHPEEWQRIPILEKDSLRAIPPEDFLAEFCNIPTHDIAELWRSGGSTGKPLFYPRTFEDIEYGRLSFYRALQCSGVTANDTAHLSFPLGVHPVGHVMARAAQHLGVGVNWAGAGNSTPSKTQIELINVLNPTIWMGMSSYGLHLANLADANGFDLAAGSVKTLICSAEQITAAKRHKIEQLWGAELYDCFGMTEAGMMGCESSAHDGFHIWTDMFFIEILDPKNFLPVSEGEVGTLVVTPLWTNNATPFLRWASGDLVTYREEGLGDGPFSVFPVIKHTHRTTGFFKVRGVNINHTDFEDLIFSDNDIADFMVEIVTQDDLENLDVIIETNSGKNPETISDRIHKLIRETFGLSARIKPVERGTIAEKFEQNVKAPRFVDNRN